ncbi:MAG TPA: DUF481 domain-containing protein [Gemmatimonadaceae bacterium]|nr:DUF481 domain-containing protein [Gemmatimonadaceae bacterium]
MSGAAPPRGACRRLAGSLAIVGVALALLGVVSGRAAAQEPVVPPPADTGAAPADSTARPLPPVVLRLARPELSAVRRPAPVPLPEPAAPALPLPEPIIVSADDFEWPSAWKRTLELAGSLFVGNKPQTVLTTRGKASHADSTFEMGADVRFTYGETSQEGGAREVSQRTWVASVNLDLWPYSAQSPFLLGTVESSFERRIDIRLSGGVGHKFTFVDTPRALANFSVAILAERSRLPTKTDGIEVQQLARFSARVRLRRQMGARTSVSHEVNFRPEYANLNQYTLSNNLSATYRLNEVVNLKLNYLDNFDTEARGRGARSNYDGQLVVGVQADF